MYKLVATVTIPIKDGTDLDRWHWLLDELRGGSRATVDIDEVQFVDDDDDDPGPLDVA